MRARSLPRFETEGVLTVESVVPAPEDTEVPANAQVLGAIPEFLLAVGLEIISLLCYTVLTRVTLPEEPRLYEAARQRSVGGPLASVSCLRARPQPTRLIDPYADRETHLEYRRAVLCECEQTMERLAEDPHYFARPDRHIVVPPAQMVPADRRWSYPDRIITGGEGSHIVDRDGNRLLDAFAGLYCVNIGYGRTEVADAIAGAIARPVADARLVWLEAHNRERAAYGSATATGH